MSSLEPLIAPLREKKYLVAIIIITLLFGIFRALGSGSPTNAPYRTKAVAKEDLNLYQGNDSGENGGDGSNIFSEKQDLTRSKDGQTTPSQLDYDQNGEDFKREDAPKLSDRTKSKMDEIERLVGLK